MVAGSLAGNCERLDRTFEIPERFFKYSIPKRYCLVRTGFRQGTDPLYRHLGQSGVPAETVGLFATHPAGVAGRLLALRKESGQAD